MVDYYLEDGSRCFLSQCVHGILIWSISNTSSLVDGDLSRESHCLAAILEGGCGEQPSTRLPIPSLLAPQPSQKPLTALTWSQVGLHLNFGHFEHALNTLILLPAHKSPNSYIFPISSNHTAFELSAVIQPESYSLWYFTSKSDELFENTIFKIGTSTMQKIKKLKQLTEEIVYSWPKGKKKTNTKPTCNPVELFNRSTCFMQKK